MKMILVLKDTNTSEEVDLLALAGITGQRFNTSTMPPNGDV